MSQAWERPLSGGQYKSGNWAKHTIASRTAAATAEGSPSTIPFPPNTYPPVSKSDIEAIIKQVLLNSGTPPSAALSMTSGSSSWFFDSACCNHMTFDSTIFSSNSSSANTHVLHTADGSHMHVSHVKSVVTTNATLFDTYLIPTLTLNLISVGQLCDLGLTITFSRTGCQVQDPQTGKILRIGCKTRRLFELINLHLSPHLTSTAQPAASVSSSPMASMVTSGFGDSPFRCYCALL